MANIKNKRTIYARHDWRPPVAARDKGCSARLRYIGGSSHCLLADGHSGDHIYYPSSVRAEAYVCESDLRPLTARERGDAPKKAR